MLLNKNKGTRYNDILVSLLLQTTPHYYTYKNEVV